MVDVSHNGDDRRTRNEIFKFFYVVDFKLRCERIFKRDVGFVFEFNAEFVGNEFRSGKIDAVVYGLHYAEHEERFDDFSRGFADLFAQSLDGNGIGGDDCVFDDDRRAVASASVFVDFVIAYDGFAVFVVGNSVVDEIAPLHKSTLVHRRFIVEFA